MKFAVIVFPGSNCDHDSYHVATLDNDAPRIFDESVQFIERLS